MSFCPSAHQGFSVVKSIEDKRLRSGHVQRRECEKNSSHRPVNSSLPWVGFTMDVCNETEDDYYYYSDCNFWYYFYSDNSTDVIDVGQLNYRCGGYSGSTAWVVLKILILATALPGNLMVLWLLASGKMGKLSSQALGLSLAVLDLLYCIFVPLDICSSFLKLPEQLLSLDEAVSVLNLIGCPLLVTGMCFERCMAVLWPLLYLKLKDSNCRWIVSALIGLVTLSLALLAYFKGLMYMSWPVTVGISVLFLLMLLCLGVIIFILCKKGPSDNERDAPRRRKALKNVLILLCPFTVAYLPILALIPFQSFVILKKQRMNSKNCFIFQTFISFPNFATYIDPMFYMSRIWQLFCRRSRRSGQGQTEGRSTEIFSRSSFAANRNEISGNPVS